MIRKGLQGGKKRETEHYHDRHAVIGQEHHWVLLAKRLGFSFVDVDIVIQEKEGRLLKRNYRTGRVWTDSLKWKRESMPDWM